MATQLLTGKNNDGFATTNYKYANRTIKFQFRGSEYPDPFTKFQFRGHAAIYEYIENDVEVSNTINAIKKYGIDYDVNVLVRMDRNDESYSQKRVELRELARRKEISFATMSPYYKPEIQAKNILRILTQDLLDNNDKY